jgi:hypothetical protein
MHINAQEVNYKIYETFYSNEEILLFENEETSNGIRINGSITLNNDSSYVRAVLVDINQNEYLVFDIFKLVCPSGDTTFSNICYETCYLDNIDLHSIKIEIVDAELIIYEIINDKTIRSNIENLQSASLNFNRGLYIDKINEFLEINHKTWRAGTGPLTNLTYSEKKMLFGGMLPNLNGFDYYIGGYFSFFGDETPSANTEIVNSFDWRNRHGANLQNSPYYNQEGFGWISPRTVTQIAGECWAFAPVYSLESLVNLYYNQQINVNLSEQDVISCSGGGHWLHGGSPATAINYLINTGVVDEDCFPFIAGYQAPCGDKCAEPIEKIQITQKQVLLGDEVQLKESLITNGPLTGVLFKWGHAMNLVGYGIVKEGDMILDGSISHTGQEITVLENSPDIGKPYYIFEQSYGSWGPDNTPFIKVIMDVTQTSYFLAYALLNPLNSLNYSSSTIPCNDFDEDGYYYWGIGSKPTTCPPGTPDDPDANDFDPLIGPFSPTYGFTIICDNFVHSGDTLKIDSNQIWNTDKILAKDVLIETGVILEIRNCTISFAEQGTIFIQQGGHLIINGAVITNPCGQYWHGIQVWGSKNASQFALPGELNPQGRLTLKNGAVIENAFNAVTLWKPNDWNSMGGIVQATNTTFRNNKRAVEFMSYQNFNPIDPSVRFGNASYFSNCTFEVNDDYIISSDFDSHITMWDVDGIKFTANTFSNDMTNITTRGYGIYTIDANFRVVPGCSQSIKPCPEPYIERNLFSNLDVGIYATNSRTSKTIYVNQTELIGNGYGVILNSVNNATIIRSNFGIGTYSKQGFACSGRFGTGIDITNSNGYIIEENNFTSSSDPSTTDVIGIRINNEPEFDLSPNEIYKNYFNALNRANLAEGKNFLTQNSDQGLVFQCNTNSENFFDFYFVDHGVAGKQGSGARAAGNTFTNVTNPLGPPRHINNLAINHVDYFHTSATNEVPTRISSNVTPYLVSFAHTCTSSFGGGGSEINPKGLTAEQQQFFEQELIESQNTYNSVSNLYESLLDGGNTEAVQADILMAWPEEMWDLRAELLGMSPLLSKEVLVSASDRTDVLPESIIFEVLAANPDELKKKELMEHLEIKDNPLPEYMIEILESLTGNVTYKTILQGQMAYHGGMENRAAGVLLRDKLNDSIRDEAAIRSFMAARQSLSMDLQIVDSYLESGETTDALVLAAMLPQLYDLTGDALAEHGRFMELKQLQAGLHNQGRSIFQLTPTEKAQLEGLVAESTGLAGMQARNTLAFVYGNDYCDCPVEVEEGLKTKLVVIPPLHKLHEPKIEASPNPANSWVSFDYQLAGKAETALLEITDTQGRQVHRIELRNKTGQYVWDTRHISPGLYYYTLKTGQASKTGKLVIEH